MALCQPTRTLTPRVNEMYKLKIEPLTDSQSPALSSQLSISGRQPKPEEMPVALQKGWNWIAYTPLTTLPINEALAAANPQSGDIVKSQTGVAIYGNGTWEGSLQALESGHGYMYYSTDSQAKQFVYPAVSAASRKVKAFSSALKAPLATLNYFTPVELYLYPNNMTMVIRLVADNAVVDTCEVAAFIGDECRGAVKATNGLYYLVVAGEGSGQPMTIRTCIDGEIVTIDDTQQFVSDDNIGTSWEPYVIDIINHVGIGTIAIDNLDDDDDWWTLQGIKLPRKPLQPGVYIHRGKKVATGRK